MHFFGPFQITKHIRKVAYKFKFLESTRIHLVFHVSLLKKFEGNPVALSTMDSFPLIANDRGPVL